MQYFYDATLSILENIYLHVNAPFLYKHQVNSTQPSISNFSTLIYAYNVLMPKKIFSVTLYIILEETYRHYFFR